MLYPVSLVIILPLFKYDHYFSRFRLHFPDHFMRYQDHTKFPMFLTYNSFSLISILPNIFH